MANRFNFRAWHTACGHKHMYYGGSLVNSQFVLRDGAGPLPGAKIMQSTGLVDDNGIEVFEGDIVHDGCCDGTYPIKWDEEIASFVFYVNDPDEEIRYIQPGNSMEVVGNIYENPDKNEEDLE